MQKIQIAEWILDCLSQDEISHESHPEESNQSELQQQFERLSITDGPFAETKEHLGGS